MRELRPCACSSRPRSADSQRTVRRPRPPQETPGGGLSQGVIRQVAAEGGGYGGGELFVERGKRVVVEEVTVDVHVIPTR